MLYSNDIKQCFLLVYKLYVNLTKILNINNEPMRDDLNNYKVMRERDWLDPLLLLIHPSNKIYTNEVPLF